MSWRKTNDFEILNENWNKVSAVTSIQRDIDLLAEEIHRVHRDILIEGAPGAFMTGVWNKGKELKNRASNVVRGLGKLSRGEATPGGIDVKSQFNLDQLQSVWKNFHNDVFKMIPKNKMVRQFPEINQAIDDLANMIARADSESGSAGSDTSVASSGEDPTSLGDSGSTVGRLKSGGEVSDEPVNTADVTQRTPIPGQEQEINTPGSQNEQPVQEPQDITKRRPGESDAEYSRRDFEQTNARTLKKTGEQGLEHLPGETGEQYVQRMLSLGPDHPTFRRWMKGDGAVPPSNDQVRQASIDKHLDDALKDDMPTDQDLNRDAAKPDQDSVKQNVEDFYAKLLKKDPEAREEPKEEPKPEVEEEPKPEVEEEPKPEVEEEPPVPSTARYMNPGDDYEATISDDKPEYASGDKEFEVGVSDDPGDDNFTMGVADDDSESESEGELETDDDFDAYRDSGAKAVLEPDDEPSQPYTGGYMGGFRPGSATTPGAGSDDAQSAEKRIQDNLDKGEPVSAADIQAMRDSGMNRDTKVTYTSPKTGEEKTVTLHSLERRRTNRESYQHKYNTIGSVGFMSDKWGQL